MTETTFIIAIAAMAAFCYIFGVLSLLEKGPLFNNAYLYATKEERQKINKKPYYRQTGIVFLGLGLIFTLGTIEVLLKMDWLFYPIIGITALLLFFAVSSTSRIKKENLNNSK